METIKRVLASCRVLESTYLKITEIAEAHGTKHATIQAFALEFAIHENRDKFEEYLKEIEARIRPFDFKR